ncbi:MAG: hypothetical protein NUW37_04175 [Planctomycetes bacterium]|nr:hypothetical protein [Planctomycetota bacterium]
MSKLTEQKLGYAVTSLVIGLTTTIEAIMIFARMVYGSASEWIERTDPPLLLEIHHGFWAAPFFVALFFLRGKPFAFWIVFSVAVSLVLSDALHHLVILPLMGEGFGWHWP